MCDLWRPSCTRQHFHWCTADCCAYTRAKHTTSSCLLSSSSLRECSVPLSSYVQCARASKLIFCRRHTRCRCHCCTSQCAPPYCMFGLLAYDMMLAHAHSAHTCINAYTRTYTTCTFLFHSIHLLISNACHSLLRVARGSNIFFQIMVTFLSYISNACHSLSGVAERLQHTCINFNPVCGVLRVYIWYMSEPRASP